MESIAALTGIMRMLTSIILGAGVWTYKSQKSIWRIFYLLCFYSASRGIFIRP